MKHLKLFEETEKSPQINDWVYAYDNLFDSVNMQKYIQTHIGQIVNTNRYMTKYLNIPKYMINDFIHAGNYDDINNNATIQLFQNEITYWGKDKNELEAKIASVKYNL